MRYTKYVSEPKGSKITYSQISSVLARRSGLTVANMVASILSGNCVSIPTQTFNSSNDQLDYQISFDDPGTAVVRVTTTFDSSTETDVKDYKVRVLDNELTHNDYY